MYVTVMTYRQLLVESLCSGQQPIMIGPIMVHYHKMFSTYLFFASSIVGECRELQSLRAFDTDGEKALREVQHLHFRDESFLSMLLLLAKVHVFLKQQSKRSG